MDNSQTSGKDAKSKEAEAQFLPEWNTNNIYTATAGKNFGNQISLIMTLNTNLTEKIKSL